MANSKISALTSATTPLAGTEVLPIVQSSATVKVAVSDLTAGRSVSMSAGTISSGNLTFSSTAQRITGDFSNATDANNVIFQTSTANSSTGIRAIPNGTGTASFLKLFSSSDTANSSLFQFTIGGVLGAASLNSNLSGTGTYLPMTFYTGGSERMRLDTSGIVTMSAYGAGAATFSATGVISSVSDETWKIKDGVPVDPDSMLKKLEPGYWYYNDEKKETFGTDRQLGFYAQNVHTAIGPEAAPQPELVTTKALDGTDIVTSKPWGYYDRSVLAVTVMSLQKALATIESLTARIVALEAKIPA